MDTIEKFHRRAMEYADAAYYESVYRDMGMKLRGAKVEEYYKKAYEYEKKAYRIAKKQKMPKSVLKILKNSAISLAESAGIFEEVEI